jgi:hypothetical protein
MPKRIRRPVNSDARRSAERTTAVEVGEARPLAGHLVKPRRLELRVAITAEVAVAEIVGINDDDVRVRR